MNVQKALALTTNSMIVLALAACCGTGGTPDHPLDEGIQEREINRIASGSAVRRNFIGVYRPSNSTWYLKMQRPGWDEAFTQMEFAYGNWNTDKPIVGDWDGNGSQTHGVWRSGEWLLCNTLGQSVHDIKFVWGEPTDEPIAGDWDGDGVTTPGLLRNGEFFLRNTSISNDAGVAQFKLTSWRPGDVPIAGDWDNDGKDDVGLYRPSSSEWCLRIQKRDGDCDMGWQYGNANEQPVVGDWDGDGVTTVGTKRGSQFFLSNRHGTFVHDIYDLAGELSDIPISGNWKPDAANGYSTVPSNLAAFFPLAVDFQHQDSFRFWKEKGINTVLRLPCNVAPVEKNIDVWTAAANSLGLKMIRKPRRNLDDDLREPNLLAWSICDEPEGFVICDDECDRGANSPQNNIEFLKSRYNSLKSADRSRPVFFTLGPWAGSPLDTVCNGPGDGPGAAPLTCYPEHVRVDDWVSYDVYPVTGEGAVGDLTAVGRTMDVLRRWSSGKPQFAYIEARQSRWGFLTPDEFRAEVWLAIIHGARGIFYFVSGEVPTGEKCPNLHEGDNCTGGGSCVQYRWGQREKQCVVIAQNSISGQVASEMMQQNRVISELAPILQSPINPGEIGIRVPPPLHATWRQHGDKRYFIVLNLSNARITPTMRVTGFTPQQPFNVIDRGERVGTSGSPYFSHEFQPYAVHVYQN